MQIGTRELVIGVAIAGVVAGGFTLRRCMRPKLSDRDQVAADTRTLASEIVRGRASKVGARLAPELTWRGMPRDELIDNLRAGTFFWRDGSARLSRLEVVVTDSGASATSTGDYLLRFRRSGDAPLETHGGLFELGWQKQSGRWRVTRVDRIELPRPN
ncbi:MAG: hypothetical protein IT370_18375 [Deltaproteobacteria bacterium]|nr:hypothetical protein [Deltaproteobacteria bacterium]